MKIAEKSQIIDATAMDGALFTRTGLLSLLDEFSHDIRNPLTVISEFASMLAEGVFESEEQQNDAAGLISEKTSETILLVDMFSFLIRSACNSVDIRRTECENSQILNSAISRLEQICCAGNSDCGSPKAISSQKVYCDPDLAACSLVYLWSWNRRTLPRDVEIDIEILPAPASDGLLFVAVGKDCRIDCDMIKQMSPPHAEEYSADLTLHAAYESARLAGGDVFVIGQEQALALFLPSADENCG